MARSLQIEQQTQRTLDDEGMYEWKVENALEIMVQRNSPMFKFGRNDSFLKLYYQLLSIDGREPRNLQIDLIIVSPLGNNTSIKYVEACFISYGGSTYFNSFKCTASYSAFKHYTTALSWTADYMNPLFRNFIELLNEGTLTFRLAWGNDVIRLHSMLLQKTPPDQTKGKIPNNSLEKLSTELETFYESKMSSDCVLSVGGEKFSVHRGILCARSPVFAAMFRHNTSESQSGVVNISDVDATVMNDVLHYIYTGQIRGLIPMTAASMYTAADKYELMELRDDCLMFLIYNLTMENISDAIMLVHLHGVSKLEEAVIAFIKENSEELQNNNTWKEFATTNPLLAITYLHSALNADSKHKTRKGTKLMHLEPKIFVMRNHNM